MKAIVYQDTKSITLCERPEPQIRDSCEVKVRVRLSGICGTDRGIYLGKFAARRGVILGHEAVGVVVEVGTGVRHLAPGERVVIDPTLWCGWCAYCREGRYNFCANKVGTEVGIDRDGTFAPYVVLPDRFLYKIPPRMSFECAVLVEPLACVLNNVEAAELRHDDTVAVFGTGPIGMIWSLVARKLALGVFVVEKHPRRLDFARRTFDRVIDAGREDVSATIRAHNGGRPPRVVVDTVGSLLEAAVELVDRGGRVVLMGFDSRATATLKPLYLTNNGIRILGAGDYNRNLQQAIEMATGFELERLITHRFPLEDYDRAFKVLEDPAADASSVMKVVFDIASDGE